MSGAARSLAYLRASIDALPRELESALQVPLPTLPSAPRSVVTTGIGASEGPARLLAAALTEAGGCARFCPASRFSQGPLAADLLVVFSQGLCPNARLTLPREHTFGARWLVTSVSASADSEKLRSLSAIVARGVSPIVIPPSSEPETLVRFVGPTVATLLAFRLAASLSGDDSRAQRLSAAPSCYRAVGDAAALDDAPLSFVTVGTAPEWIYPHRWKLLEALLIQDPPVWDVLQFAHGPLQSVQGKRLTLLVLESATDAPLLERLLCVLDPQRHRVLRLRSGHETMLAFFEHAALLDALLLATLQARPRDLFDWPARHADAPLYGFDGEVERA